MYVRCFCERSVCAAELHQRLWRGKMLPHDLGSLRESSTSFLSACSDLLLTLFLEQVCSGSRLWAQGRTLTHTQSSDVFCFYNNRQTANEWTECSWCHCDVTAQCRVKTWCLAPDFFCAELHAGASWVHGCVLLSCCFISSCGQRSEVLRLFHIRVLALCCGEGQTSFPFLCSSARVHPDCFTDLSLTSGSPYTKVMIIILW